MEWLLNIWRAVLQLGNFSPGCNATHTYKHTHTVTLWSICEILKSAWISWEGKLPAKGASCEEVPHRDGTAEGTGAGTGSVGGTIFRPLSVYRRFEIFMNSSFLAGIASFLLFFLIFKLLLLHSFNLLACSYPPVCLSISLSMLCISYPHKHAAWAKEREKDFAPIAQVEHNRWSWETFHWIAKHFNRSKAAYSVNIMTSFACDMHT